MTVPSAPSIKIRTLIVDDEPLARSNIAVLLRSDPEIQMIGECGSGAEALPEIRVGRPQTGPARVPWRHIDARHRTPDWLTTSRRGHRFGLGWADRVEGAQA